VEDVFHNLLSFEVQVHDQKTKDDSLDVQNQVSTSLNLRVSRKQKKLNQTINYTKLKGTSKQLLKFDSRFPKNHLVALQLSLDSDHRFESNMVIRQLI
jgi:hypothetical protein